MAKTRIQKVLSENGILSRRKAEEYVAQGRITVNGRRAETGAAVDPERDIIAIDGVRLELSSRVRKVYILLNKPRGYVTTLSDELGRRCVAELVEDAPERVYPVGRLDKDSEGALILTNDGEFANLIMHPSHHISKTYRVTVRPGVTEDQLVRLSSGVEIDGRMTSPAQVDVIEKQPGRAVIQMVIHEGRNRQIRKMCEAVGLEVARLRRNSVGPIRLGMLQPGKRRRRRSTPGRRRTSAGPRPQRSPPVRSGGRTTFPSGRGGRSTSWGKSRWGEARTRAGAAPAGVPHRESRSGERAENPDSRPKEIFFLNFLKIPRQSLLSMDER